MLLLTKKIYGFSISKFNPAKDYYKVLEIATSADEKQIKKSFRSLAKKYHPDSASGN
jgi:DnaJ-class molecular chaperone